MQQIVLEGIIKRDSTNKKKHYKPSIKLSSNIDQKTEAIVVIAAKTWLDSITVTVNGVISTKSKLDIIIMTRNQQMKKTLQTIHQTKLKHSKTLWNQIPLLIITESELICENSHQLRRTSTIKSTETQKQKWKSPLPIIASKSTFVINSIEQRLTSKKCIEKNFRRLSSGWRKCRKLNLKAL